MNRLIALFLLVCSFSVNIVIGQNFSVESFVLSTHDISGSTAPRLDGNGDYCALVKVRLPLVGADFEGETVGTIENKSGEYWVYMVPGSKYLIVKHHSLHPLELRFSKYDIKSLESKCTYVLTLNVPQAQGQQDDGLRYLSMTVKPVGATVLIDGNQMEMKADGTLMKPFHKGTHRYVVSAIGYSTQEGSFTINDKTEELNIELKSTKAELTISCATPETKLYIDGEMKSNNSSWSGLLSPANYVVEAKRDSYQTWRKVINLSANQQLALDVPELQPCIGTLDIAYAPNGTEVWLDGIRLGTSPDIFRKVTIGNHSLELRKEGYKSEQIKVFVEEGKKISLTGSLLPLESNVITNISSESENSNQSDSREKKSNFYVRPAFQFVSLMSYGAAIGVNMGQFNVEADIMSGIGKETLYWKYIGSSSYRDPVEESFSAVTFGTRCGYLISTENGFYALPQAGIDFLLLNGTADSKGNALSATIGCIMGYRITRHISIDINPKYSLPISKSDVFTTVSEISNPVEKWANGFNLQIGASIYF